jgi:hypothetical protein
VQGEFEPFELSLVAFPDAPFTRAQGKVITAIAGA